MLKVFYFVCSFPDTQKYSSSNWTVLALPTLTPVNTALYTRHLRSMTFKGDQDKMRRYGPRKYLCTDCNRKFALMASLKRHRTFECNKRTAMSEKIVRERLNEQERRRKKKHTCPNCNRSYKLFTSLWRHQNYECGVEPKFSCPICKNRFSQKANLERHVRTKHWTSSSNLFSSPFVDRWTLVRKTLLFK